MVDVAYRRVELAGKFSLLQPRWRGFGGRGGHRRGDPDKGYAPVVSTDDFISAFHHHRRRRDRLSSAR